MPQKFYFVEANTAHETWQSWVCAIKLTPEMLNFIEEGLQLVAETRTKFEHTRQIITVNLFPDKVYFYDMNDFDDDSSPLAVVQMSKVSELEEVDIEELVKLHPFSGEWRIRFCFNDDSFCIRYSLDDTEAETGYIKYSELI